MKLIKYNPKEKERINPYFRELATDKIYLLHIEDFEELVKDYFNKELKHDVVECQTIIFNKADKDFYLEKNLKAVPVETLIKGCKMYNDYYDLINAYKKR